MDRHTSELISGLMSALCELAEALDAKGALSKKEYGDRLKSLLFQIPEDQLQGGQAFVLTRIVDFLGLAD